MTDFDITLCHIDAIDHESAKGFDINGVSLFAVKRDGQLSVFLNSCPHLGIPLEFEEDKFLDSENFYIMCSTHGALFQTEDGTCVYGPCQGKKLSAIAFTLVDQHILIASRQLVSS